MSKITNQITGKPVKEGMDDADDDAPLEISGPTSATNEAAELADAVEDAANRLAGFIDRRPNANNTRIVIQLRRIHAQLVDLVEMFSDR